MEVSGLNRREFVRTTAKASAGLVIAFHFAGGGRFAEMARAEAAGAAAKAYPPNAFIKIAPDGWVTIMINKSEMGQGVYTSLSQLICEELDCDWTKVKAEAAPVAPVYAHTAFGAQMTGGSTAITSSYDQHRMIGAMGRAMLLQAAAETWGVKASTLKTANGIVTDPKSKKTLTYGELAEKANALPLPDATTLKLKDPKAFKLIGKAVKRLDAPAKVNGSARFGLDVRLPGMTFAVVARSPVFGGKLKSFDAAATKKVPGVVDVLQIPTGVAVIAKNTWAAQQGRKALVTDWDLGELATLDSTKIRANFVELAAKPGIVVRPATGALPKLDETFAGSAQVIERTFDFPYLAHATMEPLNCTVDYDGTKAHFYTGTHMQTGDHMSAAAILGLAPEQVQITTTFLGGSFGRRANPRADFISEAAHLGKLYKGPVQVVWTREDDMQGGNYRPTVHHAIKVGFDQTGKVTAWRHRIVAPSIVEGTPFEQMLMKGGVDFTQVEGVFDSPYDLPNFQVEGTFPKVGVPVQWWRSVGHSHTAFAIESLIDEAAAMVKMDPIEFRLKLLAKHARHVSVLKLVRDKSGWSKPMKAGMARGIAVHESFGSVVAHVAEVSIEKDQPRIHRIVSAAHVGRVINPSGATAQIESGIVYGLSAALYGAITLKDGRPQQGNFDTYRVLKGDEMPKIEAHFVPSTEHPTGLGEPGTPPTAPAVANALAKLTGKRIYALPISPSQPVA